MRNDFAVFRVDVITNSGSNIVLSALTVQVRQQIGHLLCQSLTKLF